MTTPEAPSTPPVRPAVPPVRVPAPVEVPAPARADAAGAPPTTDTGTPATTFGRAADGGFLVAIGSGLLLTAEDLAARGVDLAQGPQPLPGVVLRRAAYRDGRLTLTGDVTIPAVAAGEFTASVDKDGRPRSTAQASRKLEIPALGNPTVTLAIDEAGALAGTVENIKVVPPALGRLRSEVAADLRIAGGRLSGSGTAGLAYPGLGSATMSFRFTPEGVFAGEGNVHVDPPFLPPVDAVLTVDELRNLTGQATVDLAGQASPLPGLVLSGGTLTLGYRNGEPSVAVTGLAAAYRGLADLRIARMSADKANGFTGEGSFTLAVPLLEPVQGTVRVRPAGVSGTLTITAKSFPAGLPVKNGQIVVRLAEDGQVGFQGTVGVELGPAGKGNLTAGYDQGVLNLGAEMDLTVPGLRPVHVTVAYQDGQIGGSATVPVDAERLLGLNGNVTVQYQQGLWSGETTLAFSADDGKLTGTVNVVVAQTEAGTLAVGGSGTVTAQLMPKVSGTLGATILPEGGVDVSGTITVTEPVELFPELRTEKELLSLAKNIPLWAILVAVIRLKAGVRAGIGPGVFRNISVTGSYTIGATEADPSFSVTGELFIPAFVEGYVSFGAGLGLDVLLGELTGGIEGVATAGLYGAILVVPELFYEDGDWGIEGTATLAAGARLKLGLNAWAEVEALWVTVWDNEWKLAEAVLPIGPDLALQAHMAYRFGRPEPPTLDFTTSDIDAATLIQSAMPKDDPPPSGTRQALENKAEWKGALREKKTPPVPPEVTAESRDGPAVPEPPAKPPKQPPPPDAGRPAESQDPTQNPTPGNEQARSQAVDQAATPDDSIPPPVPESEVPATDQPRYPAPITLATLDEPPALVPRTRDQENEDLQAAQRATEAAMAASTDSDTLDNYFPRIKDRFGLSALGYQGDFEQGFVIVGEINPDFVLTPRERLSGTGVPGDLEGRKTKVDFWTRELNIPAGGPVPVGAKMVASPLGPDHPMGTPPNAHDALMEFLPSDYIRGHLLNENLGGPGEVRNLFPITRSANATHEAHMEKWVKKWVNDDKYWVEYSVTVVGGEELEPLPGGMSFVRSTLDLKASILGTDLSRLQTVETTVTSDYQVKVAPSARFDRETIAELEKGLPSDLVREVDANVQVQVAQGDTADPVFPVEVEQGLAAMLAEHGGDGAAVTAKLLEYREVGPARVKVLFVAFEEMRGRSDKTDRRILGLESGQKRDLTRVCNIWLTDIMQA